MRIADLPVPQAQVWIQDGTGIVARVDFLFAAERTILEFDGLVKYRTPEDLRAEKIREDRLRTLGYEVVRLTWADLGDPAQVRAMVLAAFARSRRRCRLRGHGSLPTTEPPPARPAGEEGVRHRLVDGDDADVDMGADLCPVEMVHAHADPGLQVQPHQV